MCRQLGFLLILLFFFNYANAQVLPKEGSTLNYRLIGFSFPTVKQVSNYKIEIAAGNCYSEDSFKRNRFKTIDSKAGKTICEVPYFGKQYTWRVIYKGDDTNKTKNNLYHFSTGIIPETDKSNTRLRIIKAAEKYKDAYVFIDGSRALYDMKGNLIWYLPYINGENTIPRDLKLSSAATITFMLGPQAYEINYNGEILWKAPDNGEVSGDNSERYHHEFTRLANGHYLILGNESNLRNLPALRNEDGNMRANNNLQTTQAQASTNSNFGTIIEYDHKGNVVWYWKCSKYFMNSDIKYYSGPGYSQNPGGRTELDVHENAFFFDQGAKMIYIGFKNISRIIKVKYPEGIVTNVYGEIFKQGVPAKGNAMFCGQHSCGVTHDGDLCIFNNNDCNWPDYPSIVILKEPATEKDTLKKIWEYVCNLKGTVIEKQNDDPSEKYHKTTGGNVIELSDGSMFASLYNPYGNVFIVTRDKKILWNAIAEQWNAAENKWTPNGQYRASIIINKKDLEHLIWNQEQSSNIQ